MFCRRIIDYLLCDVLRARNRVGKLGVYFPPCVHRVPANPDLFANPASVGRSLATLWEYSNSVRRNVSCWPFAAIRVVENCANRIAAFGAEAELHLLQLPIAAVDPKEILVSRMALS